YASTGPASPPQPLQRHLRAVVIRVAQCDEVLRQRELWHLPRGLLLYQPLGERPLLERHDHVIQRLPLELPARRVEVDRQDTVGGVRRAEVHELDVPLRHGPARTAEAPPLPD